jgi:hypothetical protein
MIEGQQSTQEIGNDLRKKKYDRATTLPKIKDISRQLPASLQDTSLYP